jgi:outer membrane protein assembly factor BamB
MGQSDLGGQRGAQLGFFVGCAVLASALSARAEAPEWPQWGGPGRNFIVQTHSLADVWPENGPTELWRRELGDGYSSILVDRGVLYTMYTIKAAECIGAFDAETGQTLWEHRNPSPFEGTQFGPGPHSTPLIVGDRLFAVGANATFHCLDKRTGEALWKRDLAEEFGAPIPYYGYAPSPIAYKNLVILPVDRLREEQYRGPLPGPLPPIDPRKTQRDQSFMAFDQETGDVIWRRQDFAVDYSSPILINFEGEDQLVLILRREIIGVGPADGDLLWHIECLPSPDENIATPVWNGEDLLFFSAAYSSGSRAIRLTHEHGKTVPHQLWYNRKLRVLLGNAILIGDYIYGSSGDFGSQLLTCVNLRTGEVAWRKRGFKKATFVYGDGKLILLDEEGNLALATATPEKLTVHATCKITGYESWTAPTLVGRILYVRDRKEFLALDVGDNP